MHPFICIFTWPIIISTFVCIHTDVSLYVYACISVYIHTRNCTCVYLYISRQCRCMYAYVGVFVCIKCYIYTMKQKSQTCHQGGDIYSLERHNW